MKKKKLKITSIIYYVLIIAEVLILASSITSKISNKSSSFLGYTIYVIATPSMSGVLEVGDVIISKVVEDSSEINDGDIVTYNGTAGSYNGKSITHQVESHREENGEYYFVTKGVANESADPEITFSQIESKYVFKSYVLTFLYGILTTIYGFILLVVIPIIYIIINEVIGIFKDVKEEKKDEKVSN